MKMEHAHEAAARIIQDAGGSLVGRTRLQKIAYLCQVAGFAKEFDFEYRHYGPFSEDLARAIDIAALIGPVQEEERRADWGGRYSIYTLRKPSVPANHDRAAFIEKAKVIDANELELAATAAFVFTVERIGNEKPGNPWQETAKRKPEKATGSRLQRAFQAYESLRKLNTPKALPKMPAP